MTEPSGREKSPFPKPSSEQLRMEINRAFQMPEISQYEQSRELRIKENLERMQKLGIVDLSLKLKSSVPSKKNLRKSLTPKDSTPLFALPRSGPVRRSSRLQNATPVAYSELRIDRKNKFSEDEGVLFEDGTRPELYSEEHEKRLGSTEKSWTLFVDGYGKDGKRIYDPVKGKTCHQCRQKTLGHRTHCSKCNMVQGQFCGDCLYMRYGEHVLEAQLNSDWICPVCRGICNCSLCRQAKGWLPTGTLYKKISRMGFKSVAHFLIQTKRPQLPTSGPNPTDLTSAKRSLSFTDVEANPAGSFKVNDLLVTTEDHNLENNAVDESENTKQSRLQTISNYENRDPISVKRSLSFSCVEQQDSKETKPPNPFNHENGELSQLLSANNELAEDDNDEKEKKLHRLKRKNGDNYSPSDECSMPEKKPTIAVELNTMDLECTTGNDQSEKEPVGVRATTSSTDQSLEKKTEADGKTSEKGANSLSKKKPKGQVRLSSSSSELKSVSSCRVLRPRHKTIYY